MVSPDLRQGRLEREHVEGTLASVVPVRPLRPERKKVGKVESREDVVLTVGWNARESEVAGCRLTVLKSSKLEHRPTALEVKNEVRGKRGSPGHIAAVVAPVLETAEYRIRLQRQVVPVFRVAAVIILAEDGVFGIYVVIDPNQI